MTDPRPVLVVTRADDVTADVVIEILHERSVPVVRLDPGDCPRDVSMQAFLDEAGLSGALTTSSRRLGLDAVRTVYWRRPSPYRAAPGMAAFAADWATQEVRWGLGGVLASLPGALYINHPWRIRDSESKIAQLAAAGLCGFRVPSTIVTTDEAVARQFIARHGPVVYKPLWNSPVTGPDGRPLTVWVRQIGVADLDETISAAPHMFQAMVDKVADIRVTAVGRQLVAVRIDGATELDWREDYDSLRYTRIEVPQHVRDGIESYLDRFGLVFAAFDFGLDRNGTFWWYEANPNGQWAFYDDPITIEIALAIADLLQRGRGDR